MAEIIEAKYLPEKCSKLIDFITDPFVKGFYCFSSLPFTTAAVGSLTNDVGKSGSLSWRGPAYLSCLFCDDDCEPGSTLGAAGTANRPAPYHSLINQISLTNQRNAFKITCILTY